MGFKNFRKIHSILGSLKLKEPLLCLLISLANFIYIFAKEYLCFCSTFICLLWKVSPLFSCPAIPSWNHQNKPCFWVSKNPPSVSLVRLLITAFREGLCLKHRCSLKGIKGDCFKFLWRLRKDRQNRLQTESTRRLSHRKKLQDPINQQERSTLGLEWLLVPYNEEFLWL